MLRSGAVVVSRATDTPRVRDGHRINAPQAVSIDVNVWSLRQLVVEPKLLARGGAGVPPVSIMPTGGDLRLDRVSSRFTRLGV